MLELLEDDAQVVALGGGAIESERVREALAGHLAVWCQVDEQTAWERASSDDERPLAADRGAFARPTRGARAALRGRCARDPSVRCSRGSGAGRAVARGDADRTRPCG